MRTWSASNNKTIVGDIKHAFRYTPLKSQINAQPWHCGGDIKSGSGLWMTARRHNYILKCPCGMCKRWTRKRRKGPQVILLNEKQKRKRKRGDAETAFPNSLTYALTKRREGSSLVCKRAGHAHCPVYANQGTGSNKKEKKKYRQPSLY